MSDDLVKRLRSTTTINPDVKLEPPIIQKQAADRIEELEANLAQAITIAMAETLQAIQQHTTDEWVKSLRLPHVKRMVGLMKASLQGDKT